MSRALAAVGLITLVLTSPAIAAGDPGEARGPVAILPFAGDGRLGLYGQPVAAELAKVGRSAGLEIILLAAGAEVPRAARLVVDGRLVLDGKAIVLEARVRDPERGLDLARRSTTAVTLAVVDGATRELALALVPAIEDGLVAQAEARVRAEAALTAVAAPPSGKPELPGSGPAVVTAARPLALLALTGAVSGSDGQAQVIAPLVAPSLVGLAARLGHRAAPLGEAGLVDPAGALVRGEAGLAIVIRVLSVATSSRRGIPLARARARVEVYDRSGLIYRRVVRTDTLVGSRGDRVDTLVRAAVAQIVDVVVPRVGEHLALTGGAR